MRILFTFRFVLVVMLSISASLTYANLSAAETGVRVYEDNCLACHGADGSPILPGTPDFSKGERLKKSNKELLKTINRGMGDIMPPWKDILTKKECNDVLAYIRKLARK